MRFMRKWVVYFILNFCTLAGSLVEASESAEFKVEFNARYATHLQPMKDISSNKMGLEFEQTFRSYLWSTKVGVEATSDSTYGTNASQWSDTLIQKNSSEFIPRDIYVQLQSGMFFTRWGYQNVVWGESFGMYYADVVNPKDLREFGIGNLARQRRQIPMAQFKLVGSSWSAQYLYIPTPQFHLLPYPGSSFFTVNKNDHFSSAQFSISDESKNYEGGEHGGRLTYLLSSVDFSLFSLDAYDRMPIYSGQVTSLSPLTINLVPAHSKYRVHGATVTFDLSGYLVRSEFVYHQDRKFQTLVGTTLSETSANQSVYVLGFDINEWKGWVVGLQGSADIVSSDLMTLTRKKQISYASLKISKEISSTLTADVTFSQLLEDKSYMIQTQMTKALSRRLEIGFGVDYFDGHANTQMDQLREANRAYLSMRMVEFK